MSPRRVLTTVFRLMMAGVATTLLAACATTDDYPAVSDDGLKRGDSGKMDAVYWRDGATLAPYNRVNIAPAEVSFRDNWMRDQNARRELGDDRIRQEDVDRIRAQLAEAMTEEFSKVLTEGGGYEVTEDTGDDVLLLRPAIIDLDVNSPDISRSRADRTVTYSKSAGKMTMNLGLYDAASDQLIGRMIDFQQDIDSGIFWISNSVTNRAEANRMLRTWAEWLRDSLDEAHGSG